MSRETLHIALRFIALLLLQVLIFNNINFLGYINPHIYILFVFLYPLKKERINFLLISFLLGLSIDFFSNSGGINAAATLLIAYMRLPLLKLLLNKQDLDYKLFKLTDEPVLKIFVFVSILSFMHHFVVFYLDYFSIQFLKSILFKTIATGLSTIFICTLSLIIFAKKKTA